MEAYHEYIRNGGTRDKKGRSQDKWQWATPDHAGTQPLYTASGDVRSIVNTIDNFAKAVMKTDLTRLKKIGKGKGISWCEAVGRDYILMNPDGVYFDKHGEYLSDDFTPSKGLKVIKIDHDGNER